MNEARAGLPAMPNESDGLEDVFPGLALQRLRLCHDQQVPEWRGRGLLRSSLEQIHRMARVARRPDP
jgi:hypothetical protein